MIRINNIKLKLSESNINLKDKAAKLLKINIQQIIKFELEKKAIDARNKNDVHYVCSVKIVVDNEEEVIKNANCKNAMIVDYKKYVFPTYCQSEKPPVIIGTGPAGLFAGLLLAQNGHNPILLERGRDVDKRKSDIDLFWKAGILNTKSNVQFGEGGAGTFSDGKLTTGIKDIRSRRVLEEFVRFGAPEEILYLSKPHIGTDILRKVVKNIRKEITRLGGEVRFESQVTDFLISDGKVCGVKVLQDEIIADKVILAIGHSARDTFNLLYKLGADMAQKPFSVGVRIEHSQEMINKSQYGKFYNQLKAADYKLAVHLPSGRSAYTFCMCPGGMVVAASSEEGMVVTNGMSNYSRDERNANSALLVGVNPQDFNSDSPLAGVEFQREIERKAYILGGKNYNAPAQLVGDFLANKSSNSIGGVLPTYAPNVNMTDISPCFPNFVTDTLKEAIIKMDKQLNGFGMYDAVLTGAETRSSSPIRIIRDNKLESNINGLYPCGEGAGYAGGIMSAAVDGIKCAEACLNVNNKV